MGGLLLYIFNSRGSLRFTRHTHTHLNWREKKVHSPGIFVIRFMALFTYTTAKWAIPLWNAGGSELCPGRSIRALSWIVHYRSASHLYGPGFMEVKQFVTFSRLTPQEGERERENDHFTALYTIQRPIKSFLPKAKVPIGV